MRGISREVWSVGVGMYTRWLLLYEYCEVLHAFGSLDHKLAGWKEIVSLLT